jgi:hypothetical protein
LLPRHQALILDIRAVSPKKRKALSLTPQVFDSLGLTKRSHGQSRKQSGKTTTKSQPSESHQLDTRRRIAQVDLAFCVRRVVGDDPIPLLDTAQIAPPRRLSPPTSACATRSGAGSGASDFQPNFVPSASESALRTRWNARTSPTLYRNRPQSSTRVRTASALSPGPPRPRWNTQIDTELLRSAGLTKVHPRSETQTTPAAASPSSAPSHSPRTVDFSSHLPHPLEHPICAKIAALTQPFWLDHAVSAGRSAEIRVPQGLPGTQPTPTTLPAAAQALTRSP